MAQDNATILITGEGLNEMSVACYPNTNKMVAVKRDELDPEDQAKYDAYATLLLDADADEVIILNTPASESLDLDYCVSGEDPRSEGYAALDYDSMSAGDKTVVDDFFALVESLVTE